MATIEESQEAHRSIIHSDRFCRLARMTRQEFARQDEEDVMGLTRGDIRALCHNYGAAVAVGLRDRPGSRAFGCVTLDIASGRPFTKEECDSCGDLLVAAVPDLVEEITRWGQYRLID